MEFLSFVSKITRSELFIFSFFIIKEIIDYNLINGIEYGSYGIRYFENKYYIYGTGIALPRASKILKGLKNAK